MVITGPEDKGKGKAVEELEAAAEGAEAQQPAPDSEAAQAAKAARDRVRAWQRLRLEGLALLADVLETSEDALGRKRSKKPEDAADAEAQLVAIRDDLQQVCLPFLLVLKGTSPLITSVACSHPFQGVRFFIFTFLCFDRMHDRLILSQIPAK